MGMDIYAGTLTRYYAHNWKTVAQQYAEENGLGFQIIRPDGSPQEQEEIAPEEIQAAVCNWRDNILAVINRQSQATYAPWPEDNQKPYYTDKPDWDAFGALLLFAACRIYNEPLPEEVPKHWDFSNHPLVRRLAQDEENFWVLGRGVECWLPLPDNLLFQGPMPNGNQVVISTTGGLQQELAKLNYLAWQADAATIAEWRRSEGYPENATLLKDGSVSMVEQPKPYKTESLAKFAFAILWQTVKFAQEQQTPILLDY